MKKSVVQLIINLLIFPLIFTGCSSDKTAFQKDKKDLVENTSESNQEAHRTFIKEEKEHFVYYFTQQDESSIEDIDKILESNYKKIVNDLKPGNLPKIRIRIYPGLEEFHKAMGWTNSPDWAVGTGYGSNELRMVSPNNPGPSHNYDSILKVAVHEFTHVVTINITSFNSTNAWLWESIALYEANQFSDLNRVKSLKSGDYPKFTKISDSIKNPEIYSIGYTVIEYIKETWSMEAVRKLIINNGDIENTLGVTPDELEKGWYEYISKKYLQK